MKFRIFLDICTKNMPEERDTSEITSNNGIITLHFLQYLLVPYGIFELRWQKFEQVYRILFFTLYSLFFLGQLKAYENANSLLFIFDNTMSVIATAYGGFLLLPIWYDTRPYLEFVTVLNKCRYSNARFYHECDLRLKRLLHIVAPQIVISYTGIIGYPLTNAFFFNATLGSPTTLIYISWYPWHVSTIPNYIATIFLQICSATMLCLVIANTILFITYCLVVIESYFTVLQDEMKMMDYNGDLFPRDTADNNHLKIVQKNCRTYDELMYMELVRLIKYHLFCIRFTKNAIRCCQHIINTSSTFSFWSLVLIMMMLFFTEDDDKLHRLKVTSMGVAVLCLILILCSFGENLNSLHHKLQVTAYGICWQRQSLTFIKSLILMLTRCQIPFMCKAFNMFNVNFRFFTYICKQIYAVLQLLTRIQRDNIQF